MEGLGGVRLERVKRTQRPQEGAGGGAAPVRQKRTQRLRGDASGADEERRAQVSMGEIRGAAGRAGIEGKGDVVPVAGQHDQLRLAMQLQGAQNGGKISWYNIMMILYRASSPYRCDSAENRLFKCLPNALNTSRPRIRRSPRAQQLL